MKEFENDVLSPLKKTINKDALVYIVFADLLVALASLPFFLIESAAMVFLFEDNNFELYNNALTLANGSIISIVTALLILFLGKRCYKNNCGAVKFFAAYHLSGIISSTIIGLINIALNLIFGDLDGIVAVSIFSFGGIIINMITNYYTLYFIEKAECGRDLDFFDIIYCKADAKIAAIVSAVVIVVTHIIHYAKMFFTDSVTDVSLDAMSKAGYTILDIPTNVGTISTCVLTVLIIFGVIYARYKKLFSGLKFFVAVEIGSLIGSALSAIAGAIAIFILNSAEEKSIEYVSTAVNLIASFIFSGLVLLYIEKKLAEDKSEPIEANELN